LPATSLHPGALFKNSRLGKLRRRTGWQPVLPRNRNALFWISALC